MLVNLIDDKVSNRINEVLFSAIMYVLSNADPSNKLSIIYYATLAVSEKDYMDK